MRAWSRPASAATAPRSTAKIGLGVLAFVRLDAAQVNATELRRLETAIRAIRKSSAATTSSGAGFELQVVGRDLEQFSRFARGC